MTKILCEHGYPIDKRYLCFGCMAGTDTENTPPFRQSIDTDLDDWWIDADLEDGTADANEIDDITEEITP